MGSIKVIISLFIVLVVGGTSILVMLFPLLFETDLKNRTGKGILNYVLTAAELICLIGVFNPGEPEFEQNLGVLVIVAAVAGMIVRNKAKKRSLDKRTTVCAVIAQILSPASILFITLMLSAAVSKLAKKKTH